MGGLRRLVPWTYGTFAVGTAAIAGIPMLSGFFSKDMILAGALADHKTALFAVAFFTALLTAFYMARLLALAFLGEYRGGSATDGHGQGDGHGDEHGHGGIHESPWVMLAPLVVLAIGSAVGGYVDLPRFVEPVFRQPAEHGHHAAWLPWAAGGAAILASLAGLALYTTYGALRERLAGGLRALARVAEEKYGFDLAYDWFARRVVVGGSDRVLWRGLDTAVIDRGMVGGAAEAVREASSGVRTWQTGFVRNYALLILGGAVALMGYLLWM
jgi:NADH-quinone oxidoreductase subunit L